MIYSPLACEDAGDILSIDVFKLAHKFKMERASIFSVPKTKIFMDFHVH